MVVFPNAKINLGLNIVSKRPDGYHNIESCFYPIPLKDALEIIPAQKTELYIKGLEVKGSISDNLIYKAYKLLKDDFNLPPVQIILQKHIPMGAGMGGGSADAAFMIHLLNDYFDCKLSLQQMEAYALRLGSDCPFFIANNPKYVEGRGEIFKDCPLNLKGYYLALSFPDIHIATKEAYSGVNPAASEKAIPNILNQPIETWKDELKNDFEESIFPAYPKIRSIKNEFYNKGALYSSMTGSGSTVYGIFKKKFPLNMDELWLTL